MCSLHRSTDLRLREREFHRVGATVAKVLSPLAFNQPTGPDHMTSGTCWGYMAAKVI